MVDAHLAPDWLTTAWLSDVLGRDVASMTVKRIGDGLVGMNLRLALTYASSDAGGPATVVAKLPSPDPTSRATGIALRNYEREVKFYRDLASTVDIRVATCHHADWNSETGDFDLILEDLSPAAQGSQITGCTVDQARTAVLELARLHGPRWDDPSLEDIEWLSRRTDDDVERLSALWTMFVPGFLATYGPALSPEAVELVHAFGPRLGDWVTSRTGASTVTHGDYRLDNLMFATPEGGYPVAAVDWQTPGHGPALGDVSYFLGAGLLTPDRRAVERDLVAEYGQALATHGVSLATADVWEQYCRDAFAGVVMTVVASQIVGESDRSEAMFTAMATRHTQHALDLDSLSLF